MVFDNKKRVTVCCSISWGMTMQQHQRRAVQDSLNLFELQNQRGLTAVEFYR